MRDLALVAIVLLAGLVALRRPWVGVMLWTWLSIMNPHRYTYDFAYTAPLAAFAAGCTLLVKGRAPGRNARSQSRSTQGHRPSSRS